MRTFVSIELPENIKGNIENLIGKLNLMLTPIKWIEKKNLHLTLKFLGWVQDDKIDGLSKCVSDCVKDFGAFNVKLEGLGVFPDQKHPRVIWIGTSEGNGKLKILAEKVEDSVAEMGFREEEREFSPHLTIGRIKENIDIQPLTDFIQGCAITGFGEFNVDHVSLMKSTLRRSGPIYEEMEQIKI